MGHAILGRHRPFSSLPPGKADFLIEPVFQSFSMLFRTLSVADVNCQLPESYRLLTCSSQIAVKSHCSYPAQPDNCRSTPNVKLPHTSPKVAESNQNFL